MSKHAELLIVDGYNILNAWEMTDSNINLEAARQDLVEILADFGGYRGIDIMVVYDAHQSETSGTENEIGSLTEVYTKKHETADSRIERMMKQKVKRHPKVTVATADYALQLFVLGAGGLRMTPHELRLMVEEARGSKL